MNIDDADEKLLRHTRKPENLSHPFIYVNGNNVNLAIFSFWYLENRNDDFVSFEVFGFGRILKTDGNNVEIEEMELYLDDDESIIINDDVRCSFDDLVSLENNYIKELQKCVDSIETGKPIKNIESLRNAFCQLVSNDALEMYRRICPDFLKMLGLQ